MVLPKINIRFFVLFLSLYCIDIYNYIGFFRRVLLSSKVFNVK